MTKEEMTDEEFVELNKMINIEGCKAGSRGARVHVVLCNEKKIVTVDPAKNPNGQKLIFGSHEEAADYIKFVPHLGFKIQEFHMQLIPVED